MLRFVVLSTVIAVGSCRPGIISTSFGHDLGGGGGGDGDDHGLSLASIALSGASHGLGESDFGSGGQTLDLGGGGSSGGGWASGGGGGYESGGVSGGSSGGDYHHGVSIVGGGGGGKGQIIDLTNQGDGGHHGPFGGSFVASSKYSAGGHGGGSDGGSHGYGISEGGFEGHYSDVLGASDDSSGGYEHLSLGHH